MAGTMSLPDDMTKSLPPVPWSVTSFGLSAVIISYMKKKLCLIRVGPSASVTAIPPRKERRPGVRQAGRRPGAGRGWGDAAKSTRQKGLWETTRDWKRQGRVLSSRVKVKGAQPRRHLYFRPQASRTVSLQLFFRPPLSSPTATPSHQRKSLLGQLLLCLASSVPLSLLSFLFFLGSSVG